ncbi:Interferon- developmental regulator 1 [Coemansia sp. RSA 1813]|nr:Interferon- developmental regulator 1 [Coemansia sp. RSA 1646]KAJ1767976.1 Interferon- developmental regulator 1 [Coemansia sp. RSA 1843]KAJ2086412.1 Interferon- developmental regulator 1 [Coemansia sp. RSA 986]KAJ2211250.1 Interferon- developmental regulator 1 [Coemansia sp. RSA 487]KAJ2564466.1 Interferon- developmental regulator 1 [Coemansia sp. RSA 1813]
MAHSTNELLRAVLNSRRTPSSGGRSGGSKQSSRKGTPKSARSARGSRAVSRNVSDDEMDDNLSIASDDTWMGYDLDDAEEHNDNGFGGSDEAVDSMIGSNWESRLQAAMDALSEKRVTTREQALAAVVKILSHVYIGDGLERNSLTCLESMRKCARTAKSTMEGQLALCGISLWFVNFGVDSEPTEYGSVSEQLKAMVLDKSKHVKVRALATGALGLVNFIAGSDYRDAAQLMEVLYKQILEPSLVSRQHEDPVVVRQALETYGLLMTVVIDGNTAFGDQLFDTAFDAHMHALAADEIDVRVAAAQNFALVHSALAREHQRDVVSLGSSPPLQPQVFEFERQEELVATLRMLRHQSAKKHGKRDTSTQRSVMRDVLRIIESGEAPRFRLAFRGKAVQFDDWTRILRLHAFRAVLGGGLPVHFVENPLLQEIFQADFEAGGADSATNGARIVVDPSSELAKARTKSLDRRRRDAHNAKSQGIDDDDY